MKKVWVLMPWCCLTFSLQACFCWHCCKDGDADSVYVQEKPVQGAEKQSVPIQLATYDLETVSLEATESHETTEKDVVPTEPLRLALQRRRASIDASGGMCSPCRYMGLNNRRVVRRPSIMVSEKIAQDDPNYAFISQKYKEALECGEFDHTDPCAALNFINHLMLAYDIQPIALPGGIEEEDSWGYEDEEAFRVRKLIKSLFPHKIFSLANAEIYRDYLQTSIDYVQEDGIKMPEDYLVARDYFERIIGERARASTSVAEATK